MLRGMRMAKDRGIRHVLIQTDCQTAANLIGGSRRRNTEVGAIVADIQALAGFFFLVLMLFLFREFVIPLPTG